jgi:hypothetical protein
MLKLSQVTHSDGTVCTVSDMCVCTHVVYYMETVVWDRFECRVSLWARVP